MADREEIILQLLETLQDAEVDLGEVEADSPDDFALVRELLQQLQEELQTLL